MSIRKSLVLIFLLMLSGSVALAVDIEDTRMLGDPAISNHHVAFVYAEDLWVADLDGKNVRRLTTDEGVETNPAFSPDGSMIAFSAQYDGNTDVYVVSAEGGMPVRLTWHPGADVVRGFTPDGKAVLFTSARSVYTNRHTQLFTVSVKGGELPEALSIPHAHKATYSPDGKWIAYTPLSERFNQWKNYRGGTASRIWLVDLGNYSVVEIPQPEGRSNDTDPMWIGAKVYFNSDRNGEFNVFSFDPKTKAIAQLTSYKDFPVIGASAGGNKIVFQQAGYLHQLDPAGGQAVRMKIGVPADLVALRPRFVKGNRYIRSASISPSGARAAFEFRGEIVTVPEEKGDPRNLTHTPGIHERSPAWSPDGRSVAYFSDAGGEYQLHVAGQEGKGEVKQYKLEGAGFYETPVWSPDSSKISYVDNSWSLYWIDLKDGKTKKIGSERLYGPSRARTIEHVWSPDSKWIVYTLNSQSYIQTIYAYSIGENKSRQITDGLSDVSEPVFDANGKYLYFLASTDAGPQKDWFAMSNADAIVTRSIYLAVLPADERSPLAKESDEEKPEAAKSKSDKDDKDEKKEKDVAGSFVIEFDGLNHRIIALPVKAGNYSNLQAGASGQIYYLQAPVDSAGPFGEAAGETTLQRFDLEKRKEDTLAKGIGAFEISGDHQKVLYLSRNSWGIAPLKGDKVDTAKKIPTDDIQVKIDPREEWKQIFDEAWRINRDYFYDPNMHGADWPAMKKKYAAFLPDLASRSDLNTVIQWMMSELSVGHHRVGGGDRGEEPERIEGGLLGADYSVENGRYRFKKVFGGLNWNPELRSPLTEPGVDVREGEYLLAVGGQELRSPTNIYSLFENTAGKIVEITVGPNPDGSKSRTLQVVPVPNESALRNRDWVEGNLRKVEKATDGRVAYVYVPNTAGLGHTYFKRYFYPQAHKEAIIIDERYNGGGQVADYYIDLLRRPLISHWAMRYGEDLKTPTASIQGPKVMIIDETAGSGGDLLPWMFRKFQLGPLVGKATWGGLVGTLGFPVLMDGGVVTAPNLAIWTEDGFIVENVGVPPDIEVEQLPAEVKAGRDPQLEKAIEVAMEELRKNPPHQYKRPPFPIRVRRDPATSGDPKP